MFDLPTVKLLLPADDFWQAPSGRTAPPATAFFKPPISPRLIPFAPGLRHCRDRVAPHCLARTPGAPSR
ncbi:hypothetical protein ACTMU2_10345 [Cupriavidus basilensis]